MGEGRDDAVAYGAAVHPAEARRRLSSPRQAHTRLRGPDQGGPRFLQQYLRDTFSRSNEIGRNGR